MRRTAASLIIVLCFAAACGGSLPSSTTVAPPTGPPSVEPSPTASETAETSPTDTQLPTDTRQPSPQSLLRLTNDPARDDTPAWSWDSQRIAFSSDRTGVYEIYAMNADGNRAVMLTQDKGTYLKDNPAWSPDNIMIAFTLHSDISRIYAFEVERAEMKPFNPMDSTSAGFPEPLSEYGVDAFSPSWAPRGGQIALIKYDTRLARQVFTLDLATRRFTQLTFGPSPVDRLSWSPDGRWIAFAADIQGNQDVFIIGSDGNDLTRLTNDLAYDSAPTWSPDGCFIAYSSDRGGVYRLHVMRVDGSYILELDTGPGEAFDPAWSPDGRYIAFASNRDGNFEIYRIDAPALEP